MRGLIWVLALVFLLVACSKSSVTGNVPGNSIDVPSDSGPSLDELQQQRFVILNDLAGIDDQRKGLEIEYWRKDTVEERKQSLQLILERLNAEEYDLEQELQRLDAAILDKQSAS